MSGIVDVGGWVAPGMELIYEQGTPAFRGQWPQIESMLELAVSRPGRGDWTHPALELPAVSSRRERHDAWRSDGAEPPVSSVPAGVLHDNSAGRVAALDEAGVDLQLINPGPSIDACLQLPSNLAAGMFGAYNRYVTAYCRPHPQRLGAVLQLHGSEPRWSAQEVAELHGEPSVRAVSLCLPVRISPEDRQFDPLWEALVHADLALLHRPSFGARIWTPGRLVAYLHGGGVFERYRGLRVGFLAEDSERSALELGRAISAQDAALRSRLFTAASAGQFHRGHDAGAGAGAGILWASDFPLRPSLADELAAARRALGPSAEEVLVAAPARFLGSGD